METSCTTRINNNYISFARACGAFGSVSRSHLVEARFEVQALALLVHGSKVAVQGSLVPLRPAPLPGGAAALEDVLQLLLARAATEDRLAQSELRDEASGGVVVTWRYNRGGEGDTTAAKWTIRSKDMSVTRKWKQLSKLAWVSHPLCSSRVFEEKETHTHTPEDRGC